MTPEQLLKFPGVTGCADLAIKLAREMNSKDEKIKSLTDALRRIGIRKNNGWPTSHTCIVCRRCVYTMKQNGHDKFNTGHSFDCPLA